MHENIRQYRGTGNHYFDIATRGVETLGLGVRYAAHPNGIGYLIVRFVTTGNGSKGVFHHFRKRERAEFIELPGGQPTNHSTAIDGARLNKIVLPVFTPPVYQHEVLTFGDSLNVWPVVGQWIQTQAELDGFTVTTDITALVRSLFIVPTHDPAAIKLALDFPDLAQDKAPKPVPVDDNDNDEDDNDNGDDDEDDGTIN